MSNWQSTEYNGARWTTFSYQASKLEQSIVATEILHSQGFGAWTTAAGCGY